MKSIDHNFDVSKELSLEDLPNEIWKDIPNYEGLYQVSNLGRVKSLERYSYRPATKNYQYVKECILKGSFDKDGYRQVNLWIDAKAKCKKVHRLVITAFTPNPDNKPQIDHINAVKTDNRVENLRWVTQSENMHNPITFQKKCGVNCPLFGIKRSEETKAKMRAKALGRKVSEETKEKLRISHLGEKNHFFGKHLSDEQKEKIRNRNSLKVINLVTGDIFSSITKAGAFYGLSDVAIGNAIKNHYKSAGFYWGYYSE